jgi:hypothetical protein
VRDALEAGHTGAALELLDRLWSVAPDHPLVLLERAAQGAAALVTALAVPRLWRARG